jgi:hypothetical protein
LDSEKDIKKEAKQLAKENNWDKLHALLYLRTKYENENRAEEAAIATNSYIRKKMMKRRNMMVFNLFLLPFFKLLHFS